MGQRDAEKLIVKISVRNLVEFILRSGDITTSSGGLRDPEAMQEGTRIHQKLQKRMGSGYRAEVSLSMEIPVFVSAGQTGFPEDARAPAILLTEPAEEDTPLWAPQSNRNFVILLEGRADGIFTEHGCVTIDEIKGVYRDIFSMKHPSPVHLAQALCYAYLYASEEHLEEIGVRMTYCHIPTEKVRYFSEHKTYDELRSWFLALIREYAKWCAWQIRWQETRNLSIKAHDFPFSYRPGQADLVKGVYQSILRKKRLYIEAPTGVGKTISTVFPAIKSLGEGIAEKIFYLTAKTITRTVAEDTFSLLEEHGTFLKHVSITAKEKICILEKPACAPETCERARGHFDRVNEAMYDVLTHETRMDRACISDYAEKHQVCPFELSLDLSVWADVIIGDYNYVFDPSANLKRFFATEGERDFVLLIDEAHNLVDRAREMYSAFLVKEDFLSMKKKWNYKSKKLPSSLSSCNRAMLELKRRCEDVAAYDRSDIETLILRLMRLNTLLEEGLQHTEESDKENQIFFAPLSPSEREELLDFYFTLREFLNIYELLDSHYTIYGDYQTNGDFCLHLQCMDPSANLNLCLKKVRCSVFFSATLLPIHYYKEQLASREEDYAIYAPSPFSTEKRLLLIGKGVSTKYTLRSPEMYEKIADYILTFVAGKMGNYLVFFPSYQILSELHQILSEKNRENFSLYAQDSFMSEEEREEFLSHFQKNPSHTTVGLCVMGGIFGEGIDLKQERLIGAVLVGTGLPMVCTENELYKEYFSSKKKDGFSYAYLYPGMNKVLQAAGRVIRTTEDHGAILLLDDRFLRKSYTDLFPKEWYPYETTTLNTLADRLASFWEKPHS